MPDSIDFTTLPQIETLFGGMEPLNLDGESFTPSLHAEEMRLDDAPPESESDEEIDRINQAKLGPFTPFSGSLIPVPLAAVDAGVLDIGISKTGFALAFKASVIVQNLAGTPAVTKVGPRVKFIAPNNQAEILRFIGRELMHEQMFVEIAADGTATVKAGGREPNQFKDRIRNFIERMLQLDIARQLKNGIMLVDGALTLRTYNTPQVFLERLGREAGRSNTDIVGVSKKSRLTVDGVHLSALLDDAPPEAGYRRIITVDAADGEEDATERNLGVPFAVRFSPGGFTFRVDVARRSIIQTEEQILEALYTNTQMTLGYPNLLRLAHIHSAFTKAEILSLQVQTAHDYHISMRMPEDLSVIFGPFRKGLGG